MSVLVATPALAKGKKAGAKAGAESSGKKAAPNAKATTLFSSQPSGASSPEVVQP